MSAAVTAASGEPRPTRPSKAGRKRLNAAFSSRALPPGLFAPERSPRQCIGPLFAMPRRVCVVIGPLIGWKFAGQPKSNSNTLLSGIWLSSGLPRSQARLSKSPNTWHDEHDVSPLLEVPIASEGRRARALADGTAHAG